MMVDLEPCAKCGDIPRLRPYRQSADGNHDELSRVECGCGAAARMEFSDYSEARSRVPEDGWYEGRTAYYSKELLGAVDDIVCERWNRMQEEACDETEGDADDGKGPDRGHGHGDSARGGGADAARGGGGVPLGGLRDSGHGRLPSGDVTEPGYYAGNDVIGRQERVASALVALGAPPDRAFDAATAVKYLDRRGSKDDRPDSDMGKAVNYLFSAVTGRWPWEADR